MPHAKRPQNPASRISEAFLESAGFLKKFLARFLSNQQDIEDVLQEAYLRAFAAEQRTSIEHPKAFLFRVARNVALTELTRKSRQITDYLDLAGIQEVSGSAASAADELEAQERLGMYCEAVAALPSKCREAFLLRKVHGMRHKDIAERMGLSVSSVEKYLQQGILGCRSHLREKERSARRMTVNPDNPGRGSAHQ